MILAGKVSSITEAVKIISSVIVDSYCFILALNL